MFDCILNGSPPDAGYSWVVLVAATMSQVIYGMQFGSIGVLLVEFTGFFDVSSTAITAIATINTLTGSFFCIFQAMLLEKLGIRGTMILSSVVACLSFVLPYVWPNIYVVYASFAILSICYNSFWAGGGVSVQKYFDKKRTMAIGVYLTGSILGISLWSVLTEYFIREYTWQGTLLLLGGFNLNHIPLAMLCSPPVQADPLQMALVRSQLKTTMATADERSTEILDSEASSGTNCTRKSIKIWLIFAYFSVAVFLTEINNMAIQMYIPTRAKELGFSSSQGAMALSIGCSVGLLRSLVGWFGDRPYISRPVMHGIGFIAAAALTYGFIKVKSYVFFVIIVTFICLIANVSILESVIIRDIVGTARLALTTPMYLTVFGASCAVLNFIAGYSMERFGSTDMLFWLGSILQIIGGAISISVKFLEQHYLDEIPTIEVEINQLSSDNHLSDRLGAKVFVSLGNLSTSRSTLHCSSLQGSTIKIPR